MYEPGWPLDIDLPLDERKRIVALARRRVPFWKNLSLGFVTVAAVTIVGFWSITWPSGGAWWVRALFAAGLIVISFGISWRAFRLTRLVYRSKLREILNEQGYPVCVGCGYDLRHAEPRMIICPECGMAISPKGSMPDQAPQ